MEQIKFWKSPGGLFLPVSLLPKRHREASAHRSAVMLDAKLALGLNCTYEGAAELVRGYSFEEVLSFVARVGAMTHHMAIEDSPQLQDSLLGRLFQGRELERISHARRNLSTQSGVTVAFGDRQMLGLLKVGSRECKEVRGGEGGALRNLAVAALMVNGFIDGDAMGDSQSEIEKELYLFANLLFEHRPNLVHAIGRAHEMFNADNPRSRKQPQVLGRKLRTLVGVDPDELLAVFFGLNTPFYSMSERDIDAGQIAMDLGFWTRGTEMPLERLSSFADLLAIDIEELRDQMRLDGGPTPGWFGGEALRRRPLVRVGGAILCPFPRWMDWAISGGVEFRLMENQAESGGYLSLRGDILEYAVRRAFERVCPGRVIYEDEIKKAVGAGKVCEMIVDYGDAIVLVECKAGTVGAGARAGESVEAFSEYVKRTYKDPLEKFESVHRAVVSGAFESSGIVNARLRAIYPVMVNYEAPIAPLTAIRLEREALTHPLWADRRVRAPQYLTIEETELLEAWLSGLGALTDLLEEKVHSRDASSATFTNFIATKAPSLVGAHSPYFASLYERLSEEYLTRWREWGLRPS